MINLLSNSQNRNNLQNLFNQIKDENIFLNRPFISQQIDIDDYETNSFTVIQELGLVSIKEFDQITFEIIIKNIYWKFISFSSSEKSKDLKKALFYRFRDILSDLFEYSAKEKNSAAMKSIISCRFGIESKILEEDDSILKDINNKYLGWTFNYDLEKYYDKAIQFNEDMICCNIVDCLRDYLTEIIKYKLPNKLIYKYDTPHEYSDEKILIMNNLSLVENFLDVAGQLKKNQILKNISNLFSTLDIVIIESNNVKDTKKFLLSFNNNLKQKYLKSLIENANIKNIDSLYYPFSSLTLDREVTELSTAIVFRGSLTAFEYLFNKNALNSVVINSLKTFAMNAVNLYEKNKVASA